MSSTLAPLFQAKSNKDRAAVHRTQSGESIRSTSRAAKIFSQETKPRTSQTMRFESKKKPNAGVEPATLRLRVSRSAD
ncbi:hypothetical protein BJX99DRAFT_228222 [Aspergillus californicus]